MKSYQKVFGGSIKTGMITGKSHDYDADFIFATVQTLSKTENLERFQEIILNAAFTTKHIIHQQIVIKR